MNKKLEENKYLLPSNSRIFLANLFDSLVIFVMTVVAFFGIIRPIYFSKYQEKADIVLNENKNEILKIGQESHLFYYNDKFNTISDVSSLYKYFVLQNIKYCYENYPNIYKEDLDNVGYETKKEIFKNYKSFDYSNVDLAYFITNYLTDKKDNSGQLILENNSKNYFIDSFLDINSKGSEFYIFDGDYDDLPRLKVDVCRYLFQYHVMNISYSTLRETDASFEKYYVNLYKEAGNLLMKINEYSAALTTYNDLYKTKNKNLISFILLSYLISLSLYMVIIPLFLKDKQTLSDLVFKMKRLDFNKKQTDKSYFVNIFSSFIKQFYLILIICFIENGANLMSFTFIEFGAFTISIFHIGGLFIILSLISMIIKFSSKNHRSISERLFKVQYFEKVIS